MHRHDKELEELSKEYKEIKVPDNIDQFIMKGISQAQVEERVEKKRSWHWLKRLSLAAAILLLSLVLTVRYSPALAHYIGTIPGFERFVQWVHYDKGLMTALEHEHYQAIGVSDVQQGITFTVDHIIVDEGRIIIFHSVEGEEEGKRYSIDGVTLENEQGEVVTATASYGMVSEEGTGRIDITFNEKVQSIPEYLTLKVTLRENEWKMSQEKPSHKVGDEYLEEENRNVFSETWVVSFAIDRAKFEGLTKEYHINDTLAIANQKIHIHSVTIYPTRVAIHLEFDENNTMKILDLSGLELVDERGATWAGITNGISASYIAPTEWIVYMQSAYFSYPKELYLQINEARALPKENAYVVVDLERKQLIAAPDEKLNLINIQEFPDRYYFQMSLSVDERNPLRSYFVVAHDFHDEAGNEYSSILESSSSSGDEQVTYLYFSIPKEDYQGFISFPVAHYPSYIDGFSKVEIYR